MKATNTSRRYAGLLLSVAMLLCVASAGAQTSGPAMEVRFSIRPFPLLRGQLSFRDSSNNAELEPGESGRILLTLTNTGNGGAGSTRVILVPASVPHGVDIQTIPQVRGISSGEYVTLEIPVLARPDADPGDLQLHAEIRDSAGYLLAETRRIVVPVRVPSQPLASTEIEKVPPTLKIYDFDPDEAFVSSDSLGEVIITNLSRLTLRGYATDSSGVVAVMVNGSEAHPTPRKDGLSFRKDVLLVFGDNELQVEALDPYFNTAQKSLRIRRVPEALGQGESGFEFTDMKNKTVYAVVIGISKYENANVHALKYADRDAKSFAEYLHTPIAKGGRGVPLDNVRLLLNEQATFRNIREALFEFSKKSVRDDMFFIFFAGHGSPDPVRSTEYYFLPYDANPFSLGGSALRQSDIQASVQNYIGADVVIGFFDACHGAAVSDQLARRSVADSSDIRRFLMEVASAKPGVLLFSASEVNEVSFEGYRWGEGHGVFTYHLLEGLKGKADRDGDNFVLLGELVDFVSERVQRETENQQHPTKIGAWDRKVPMSLVVPDK